MKSFCTLEFMIGLDGGDGHHLYLFSNLTKLKAKVNQQFRKESYQFFENYEGQYNLIKCYFLIKVYDKGDLIFVQDILPLCKIDVKGFQSLDYPLYYKYHPNADYFGDEELVLKNENEEHIFYDIFEELEEEEAISLSFDWNQITLPSITENIATASDSLQVVIGNPVDMVEKDTEFIASTVDPSEKIQDFCNCEWREWFQGNQYFDPIIRTLQLGDYINFDFNNFKAPETPGVGGIMAENERRNKTTS